MLRQPPSKDLSLVSAVKQKKRVIALRDAAEAVTEPLSWVADQSVETTDSLISLLDCYPGALTGFRALDPSPQDRRIKFLRRVACSFEALEKETTGWLIFPARSAFTSLSIVCKETVNPFTGQREKGLSQAWSNGEYSVPNTDRISRAPDPGDTERWHQRILSDQFVSIAFLVDASLGGVAARDILARGTVLDDIQGQAVKGLAVRRVVQDAVRGAGGSLPHISGGAVFDVVREVLGEDAFKEDIGCFLSPDETAAELEQMKRSLDDTDADLGTTGRKEFLDAYPYLAGRAFRRACELHTDQSRACAKTASPLLPWSPVSKGETVPDDVFNQMLFDTDSWDVVETTPAKVQGEGLRDYELLPQGRFARMIEECLGDGLHLVDIVFLHLTSAHGVLRYDFSITPVVRLRPLDVKTVRQWLDMFLTEHDCESVEKVVQRIPEKNRKKYKRRLLKEASQLVSFILSRRLYEVVQKYVIHARVEEDTEYAQFLLGKGLYDLVRKAEWDSLACLKVMPDTPSSPLGQTLQRIGLAADPDKHFCVLGDKPSPSPDSNDSENSSIYRELMGYCTSDNQATADYTTGHMPGPDGQPCQNQYCKHWSNDGILKRDTAERLTTIQGKLQDRGVNVSRTVLRLHLAVLALVGFAVPTSVDGEDAYLRGESGEQTFGNPLNGKWASVPETVAF